MDLVSAFYTNWWGILLVILLLLNLPFCSKANRIATIPGIIALVLWAIANP